MKRVLSSLLTLLLSLQPFFLLGVAQGQQAQSQSGGLSNKDVLALLKSGLMPEIIIAKIKVSPCNFDTSPSALTELKTAGVQDAIILAMIQTPSVALSSQTIPGKIKLPDNTTVEVELSRALSSNELAKGDIVSFAVAEAVAINGMIVIEKGASARATVTKNRKAGLGGDAGEITWSMDYVIAADGSRVPLRFTKKTKGSQSSGAVTTAAVLTTLALGPIGLLWGFKKGKDAVVPAGKRFEVFVNGDTLIETDVVAARKIETKRQALPLNLNGTWNYQGTSIQISHNGQNIRATYATPSGCRGALIPYLLNGQLDGHEFRGKMLICTDEQLVKSCNYNPLTEVSFKAIVKHDQVSAVATIPQMFVSYGSDGRCLNIINNTKDYSQYSFMMTRVTPLPSGVEP